MKNNMQNAFKKRISACLLIAALLLTVFPFSASATKAVSGGKAAYTENSESGYEGYISDRSDMLNGKKDFIIAGGSFKSSSGVKARAYTDLSGKKYENCAVNEKDGALADYTFNITEDGLYNLYLLYAPVTDDGNALKLGIKIDGEYPFDEASNLELSRWYVNDGDIRTDEFGNEYLPSQRADNSFSDIYVTDYSGSQISPYLFYLTKGEHTVTLTFEDSRLAVARLGFKAPESVPTYADLKAEYKRQGYTAAETSESLIIEGEAAVKKNSRSVVARADCSSCEVVPSDPVKERINYIGGSNWKNTGDEVVWEFNVEKSGLYRIGFNFKQDQSINLYSYRSLKIDGKAPFAECQSIKFGYDTDWQFEILGGDEPYDFYLDEGMHTLSLSVTLGETAEIYKALKNTADALGDLYLDITMITGEAPDSNRDYELHNQVPEFTERLAGLKAETDSISAKMKEISSGKTNSFTAALNDMSRVLSSMLAKPYEAQVYVSDYYTSYSTVTSWLYDMKSMPLSVDRIQLTSADTLPETDKVSFFKKIDFSVKRFLASFSEDYEISSEKGNRLTIWVNWGRDQAMVLNSLINEDFTPKTGIDVDLKITNASLLMGMLSGNAPDLSLQLARTEPLNLAMRGALYDLTEFSDFNEVMTRFAEGAEIPYTYEDGVYALPDTQSFYVMFYRKDVLAKLGIQVPNTWDEFLTAASVLQINNMDAYIPYTQITDATVVNTGVGGLNLYATILQQFGGELYNLELNTCLLDSTVAYSAFKYWTDMYVKKKLPTTASFYNRFRSGTMPLGIDVYTQYTTLLEAAPEIQGRWGIALVPGLENDDGSINRTIAGAGTGCSIIKSTKNADEAWEFLKWWTSADTQSMYNDNVEAVLGAVSRVTTSNVEAFKRMAWEKSDLSILLEQRGYIKEIPEVPGSYFVSRAVDQAFWNVVESNARPKDTLFKWSNICNNEIKRKIEEYKSEAYE